MSAPLQTQAKASSTSVQTQSIGSQSIIQRKCACGNHATGGECEECKKKKGMLQRKSINNSDGGEVPPIVYEVLRSIGKPLDKETREFMELRYGHDFSHVRVHADETAAQSASVINAIAYTVGKDIVFGRGQYDSKATRTNRLLAHELAHTIQQANQHNISRGLNIGPADDLYEREADASAYNVLKNDSKVPVLSSPKPIIQRSIYSEIKEKAYSGLIAGLREAKNTAMNYLRSRASKLPSQFQSPATTLIYIVETIIEIIFSVWFAIIGMVVGFSEGIVDMVKGIITLGYGVIKLLVDICMAAFDGGEALTTDLNAFVEGIKALPEALTKCVNTWIAEFKKAPTERQSLMIGELTGQVLAIIATWGATATRVGSGARVATGGADVIETAVGTTTRAMGTTTTAAKTTAGVTDVASTAVQTAGSATKSARPALRIVETGGNRAITTATTPKPIPAAFSQGGTALKYAPEIEEAAVVAKQQPLLKIVPKPVEPLPIPTEPVPTPAPLAMPSPATVVAPTEAAAKGISTGKKIALGVGVAAATAAGKKSDTKNCNDEPCDILPIIWPHELPPPTEFRPLKRTSGSQREAEGIDRGPDQRKYRDCLTAAHERGEDLQSMCGHLGGDWFDPDLLPSEHVDAHHMQPLYLGGEDAPYNLGAVEFNRHRLGHKLLNDQTLMFETHPTWIHCRICSPHLTKHPIDQEYEIYAEI